jgi:isopentenyl phosphate kinase
MHYTSLQSRSTTTSTNTTSPIFLKLGGSLITDKRQPETPRPAVIQRLAEEIAQARRLAPGLHLVIGHGSGSFGHVYGQRYGTRAGVQTAEQWYGYAATGDAAARLNRLVTAALLAVGVPAWSVQPGAALRCVDGRIADGPLATIRQALAHGLVPVVFGDVALDEVRGGTIVSTEEIFEWLAGALAPRRLVLAGEVAGVFTADPTVDPSAQLLAEITPTTLAAVQGGLGGSHGVDVTGGMAAKVMQSLAMAQAHRDVDVIICSGLIAGQVQQTLLEAQPVGTRIHAQDGSA